MKNVIALLIIMTPVLFLSCVSTKEMENRLGKVKMKYEAQLDTYKRLNPLPVNLIARQKQADFTDSIGTWFNRIGVVSGLICAFSFGLTFVSSLPTKALTRVSATSGVIFIVCITSLVGLAYWKIVATITFFVLIIYGGFKMWDMREDHLETKKQLNESIEHFDDPKGINKLSKNTRIAHATLKGNKLIDKEMNR